MLGLANMSICASELDEALCRENVPEDLEYARFMVNLEQWSEQLKLRKRPTQNLVSLWQFGSLPTVLSGTAGVLSKCSRRYARTQLCQVLLLSSLVSREI